MPIPSSRTTICATGSAVAGSAALPDLCGDYAALAARPRRASSMSTTGVVAVALGAAVVTSLGIALILNRPTTPSRTRQD